MASWSNSESIYHKENQFKLTFSYVFDFLNYIVEVRPSEFIQALFLFLKRTIIIVLALLNFIQNFKLFKSRRLLFFIEF